MARRGRATPGRGAAACALHSRESRLVSGSPRGPPGEAWRSGLKPSPPAPTLSDSESRTLQEGGGLPGTIHPDNWHSHAGYVPTAWSEAGETGSAPFSDVLKPRPACLDEQMHPPPPPIIARFALQAHGPPGPAGGPASVDISCADGRRWAWWGSTRRGGARDSDCAGCPAHGGVRSVASDAKTWPRRRPPSESSARPEFGPSRLLPQFRIAGARQRGLRRFCFRVASIRRCRGVGS